MHVGNVEEQVWVDWTRYRSKGFEALTDHGVNNVRRRSLDPCRWSVALHAGTAVMLSDHFL